MAEPFSVTGADFASDVIDVTGVSLADLDDVQGSVFDTALRRLTETDSGPVAGFTASIGIAETP